MSRADDLGRLREEMQAGQRNRMEFVDNLARSSAEMKRANQAENKQRRRNLQETLMAFVTSMTRSVVELRRTNQAANKERQYAVGALLGGFHDAHQTMAKEQQQALAAAEGNRKRVAQEDQTARLEFVTNLAGMVAGLRKANQAGNASAHAAWHGARTTRAVSAKRGGKWFGRVEAE